MDDQKTNPNTDPGELLYRYFTYAHLPDRLAAVAARCADMAEWAVTCLPAGPERSVGMRKLLEAKDCFVRAALTDQG
jgi:hypothetical protein